MIFQSDTGAEMVFGATGSAILTATTFSRPEWARGKEHLAAGRFISGLGSDLMVIGGPGSGAKLFINNGQSSAPDFTLVWSNTGLLANFESIVVGNFGGPGTFDDVLFVDDNGSFMYLGTGSIPSPWQTNAWTRSDLKTRNTQYAVGDWTNDGLSDLWIVNPGGTYGYIGQANGIPTEQWSDTSLKLQAFVLH